MKKTIAILVAVSGLIFTAAFSNSYEQLSFPENWYRLPEDGGPQNREDDKSHFSENQVSNQTKDSLDESLQVNSEVLEEVLKDPEVASSRQDSQHPWRLAFFGLDIGLSASGVAGILFAKGEAVANLYWKNLKNQPVDGFRARPLPSEAPADFTVRGPMTPQQIEAALQPVVAAVEATGKVKNHSLFRKNLLSRATEFTETVSGIEIDPGMRWTPSRVRFDFNVDASGMVMPGLTVGGGVKIRFDWFPSTRALNIADNHQTDTRSARAKDMDGLLKKLSHELQTVRIDDLTGPKDLPLGGINFSLALFANANFGVAKAAFNAMGMVYFKPNAAYQAGGGTAMVDWSQEKIPLVESSPSAEHLQYAKAQGINTRLTRDEERVSQVAYDVPHEALRWGLEKSSRMGNFLAERAIAHQSQNWRLDQLRVQFALSLGGSAGLVTVGGTGAVQLIFQAK